MNNHQFNGAEFNGVVESGGVPGARISVASPIGQPALFAALIPESWIAVSSPLGAPALTGGMVIPAARISVASPLGSPYIIGRFLPRVPKVDLLTAYISGAEDDTTDYPIPLATFSVSKRSAAASYYAISAPYTDELLTAITERPNGIIYIRRDGYPWESFNVGHPIQYDLGPTNKSISINGTRQSTNNTPSDILIEPRMVISDGINSDGLLTLDLVPGFIDPRPGDQITWDSLVYTVLLKKYQAGNRGQTLSINAEVGA